MKRYLSSLCFALASFFYTANAAAALLLKQNPTPLEPASYSVFGGSYQIARVTWLPDYLGNNKSHGSKRSSKSSGSGGTNCAAHGLLASCPEHKAGKGVKHPVAGLTCYEECVCDTSYYKYNAGNCLLPKILSGNTCTTAMASACTCPSDYTLAACPEGTVCSQCDSRYKFVGCKEGYVLENGNCIKKINCDDYTLTVCPSGGICSQCSDNGGKFKIDGCDKDKGWNLSADKTICEAVDCPAGYTAGVTMCSDNDYTYKQNGMSGGLACGACEYTCAPQFKYTFDMCQEQFGSDYEQDCPHGFCFGKCEGCTKVPKVLYGDGSVVGFLVYTNKYKRPKAKPIGIVFDEENRLAIALTNIEDGNSGKDKKFRWAVNPLNIPAQYRTDTNSPEALCPSTSGRENTNILLSLSENIIFEAAEAVNNYEPEECEADFCRKGNWFLPSEKEWDIIKAESERSAIINVLIKLYLENVLEESVYDYARANILDDYSCVWLAKESRICHGCSAGIKGYEADVGLWKGNAFYSSFMINEESVRPVIKY